MTKSPYDDATGRPLMSVDDVTAPGMKAVRMHGAAGQLYTALEALVEACIKDYGPLELYAIEDDGPVAAHQLEDFTTEGSALTYKHIRDGIAALKAARGE